VSGVQVPAPPPDIFKARRRKLPGFLIYLPGVMMQYPSILSEKTAFISSAADKLGNYPSDYKTSEALNQQPQATELPYQTAGVILLINYRQPEFSRYNGKGEFFFSLIKRSSTVSQPGDLSCPGGMLHPSIDPLLRSLFAAPFLPIMKNKAYALAKSRDAATFRLITLYLANALREAWEEIRLNPFHVSFIGPLPTHPLILFKRVIFPLVGMIKKSPWKVRANDEVERIVEIPLRSFYDETCFGRYIIEHTLTNTMGISEFMEFPCLIQKNDQGGEDVLWGATFNIIINFLKIVLGYQIPDWQSQRIVRKTLPKNYISGGSS
jgi:hypothetical protein